MASRTSSAPTSTPSLPPGYTLVSGPPPVDVYLDLRALSGLTPKTHAQGVVGLPNSWCAYHIVYAPPTPATAAKSAPASSSSDAMLTAGPVAMGRIIGDGGWYFDIADMAVLPDHQRKGLGEVILRKLLEEIRQRAPDGGKGAYVNLLADAPGRKLYAKLGFEQSAPRSVGMHMVLR